MVWLGRVEELEWELELELECSRYRGGIGMGIEIGMGIRFYRELRVFGKIPISIQILIPPDFTKKRTNNTASHRRI